MTSNMWPKLRGVQVSFGQWQGQPVVVLQDPLRLSDRAVALPQSIAPVLELCDGTRDCATLRSALELRTGLRVGPEYIDKLLFELDEALLLDNDHFARVYRGEIEKYRSAPSRPPTMAGTVYPSSPELLEGALLEYFNTASPRAENMPQIEQVRGLVSPHIDYQRGGAIYAEVWRQAATAARSADVAIILGTNHFDCRSIFALTRQSYSTPWGILSTASDVVDRVVTVLGEGVFDEELHHRMEHSVETAAVWLHYLVKDRYCELVPVLCGSFQKYIAGGKHPGDDEEIALFVDAVRQATANRRTLIVAAGDLAHVGPAFGDRYPVGLAEKANLSAADSELMAIIAKGDAEGLFQQVKREGDRRRICGLAPIYLALRLLGETTGKITGYAQCPADQQETSFVSICGILLS